MRFLFGFLLIHVLGFAQAQWLDTNPFSTAADTCFSACPDTLRLLNLQRVYDLGVILPSWAPVVGSWHVSELEGTVLSREADGSDGPHVSHEDLPFYHYTHDFVVNIVPDSTPDRRYLNLLPMLVSNKFGKQDTLMRRNIHCEWESGLGARNPGNIMNRDNDFGRSGGFFSKGHERRDILWHWPSIGDWMHIEGKLVWDRGHPPAKTEIHPMQFTAVRRRLPAVLPGTDSTPALRIDVFAHGDGGALWNNRKDVPSFVRPMPMSVKDYSFTLRNLPAAPSSGALLKYKVIRQKGDNFSAGEIIEDLQGKGELRIRIPWKTAGVNDTCLYARTIYVYWDDTTAASVPLYRVTLEALEMRRLNEKAGAAEPRFYVDVAGQWIFLNDFFGKGNRILSAGLGKTRKKKWKMNLSFLVSAGEQDRFRVMAYGYERDGVDLLMGNLFDPESECNTRVKRYLKSRMFSIGKMLMKGCMDDQFGAAGSMHGRMEVGQSLQFRIGPNEKQGKNEDPCPGSKYSLKDRFFLSYRIERLR